MGVAIHQWCVDLVGEDAAPMLGDDLADRQKFVAAGWPSVPPIDRPAKLDLEVRQADQARFAALARGVSRTGDRSVRIESDTDNLLEICESFMAVNRLVASVSGV